MLFKTNDETTKQEMTTVDQTSVALSDDPQAAALALAQQYDVVGDECVEDKQGQPILVIAQGQAKELKPGTDEYIDNLKQGDFLCRTTGEVIRGPVNVVICHTVTILEEWVPYAKGGGIVATYDINDPIRDTATPVGPNYVLENGNDLKESKHVYMLVEVDGIWRPFKYPISGTAHTPFRNLSNKLNAMTMPGPDGLPVRRNRFTVLVEMGTRAKTNEKGSFFVPTFTIKEGYPPVEVMKMGGELAQFVQDQVKLDGGVALRQIQSAESKEDDTIVDAVVADMA